MISDGRTGNSVTYNLLNLPATISQSTDKITYTYTAAGEKLQKAYLTGGVTNNDYYMGSFVYSSSKGLNYILFEEGVVKPTTTDYSWEYNLKDHLGNTRVVFSTAGTSPKVEQVADYYPFGQTFAPMAVNNVTNKYLYNGKEMQDDKLASSSLNWYDYGARFYDPQIGRWSVIDPKIEKYFSLSPYNYGDNNPIKNIDLYGKDIFDINGNHIKSDNTNIIKIQTFNGLINFSSLSMGNMNNRQAAANITAYYAGQVGISGRVGVANDKKAKSGELAFTTGSSIYLHAKGGLNKLLDNENNLKSTLFHEKLHKDRNQGENGASNLEHAQVYLDQMKDKTFTNTTSEFKNGVVASVSKYIEGAAEDLATSSGDLTKVADLVSALNNLSNVTGCNVSLKIETNGFHDPSLYDYKVSVYKKKKD
jgi:RHS repeat-associated protein